MEGNTQLPFLFYMNRGNDINRGRVKPNYLSYFILIEVEYAPTSCPINILYEPITAHKLAHRLVETSDGWSMYNSLI